LIKSTLKPSKITNDESPSISTKLVQQLPVVQPRPSTMTRSMTRSMTVSNHDSPQIMNSDVVNESFQTKPSMSASLYSSLVPPNNNNEQKETNNSMESVSSSGPPVSARIVKPAIGGTRVLPVLDPNGDAPPVKLRHFQPDRKGRKTKKLNKNTILIILLVPLAMKSPSIENTTILDIVSSGTVDSPAPSSLASNTVNPSEQYKRMNI
jgi:hypothetical protein